MPDTKIIWKRPDGFHGASPEDYRTFELNNGTKLWLHRSDKENYPFRIAGGWQDEVSSKRINTLLNLLGAEKSDWKNTLNSDYQQSGLEHFSEYIESTLKWIDSLQQKLKGDTWEQDIMASALTEVCNSLKEL
ncbi:MAG: hypothetical protein AB8C84_06090 [Oligoflexales bacterium]